MQARSWINNRQICTKFITVNKFFPSCHFNSTEFDWDTRKNSTGQESDRIKSVLWVKDKMFRTRGTTKVRFLFSLLFKSHLLKERSCLSSRLIKIFKFTCKYIFQRLLFNAIFQLPRQHITELYYNLVY